MTLHRLKRSSYYTPDERSGAALLRARRPYLFKNAVTGIAIFGFAIGVCTSYFPNPLVILHPFPQSLAASEL